MAKNSPESSGSAGDAPAGHLLLSNIGRLGDTILRNAIIASARMAYASVHYLCGRHNADIVRTDPRLREITVLGNSFAGFSAVLKAIARRRYEGYIELKDHGSTTSVIIARLFRSRLKTGCNRPYLRPFHRDVRGVLQPVAHVLEMTRRIGMLAGLPAGEYKPSLFIPAASVEWFRKQFAPRQPFIFLNVSATHERRLWPTENWVRFVQGLRLAAGPLLVSGVPAHTERVRELCARLPGSVAFQPRSFLEVAAAVADARLVLTVDTGIVHLCSALDKPLVGIFANDDSSVRYAPLSTRHLTLRPRSGRSVAGLSAEEAIAEVLKQGLWRDR